MKNAKNIDQAQFVSGRDNYQNKLISHEPTLAWNMLGSLQGVAIIAVDAKYNVNYANSYAREIFNLDLNQVASGTTQLPKAVHKRIITNLKRPNTDFILQYALKNELRTLKVFTSKYMGLESQKSGYVLHMHDITDRVCTELQLRKAEELLRNLIDASPDLICFKDAKNRWLEANSSSL